MGYATCVRTGMHIFDIMENFGLRQERAWALLLLYVTCGASVAADGTAIGDLAESMQPGEWAELTTNNIGVLAAPGAGSTHSIQEYSTGGAWDPVNKVLYFLGSSDPHISDSDGKFVTYSAATNTWTEMPDPSWYPSPGEIQHSYDHNTFDTTRGTFYYHPFGYNSVHAFDVTTQSWSEIPDLYSSSGRGWVVCCSGLEYFPERDSLIWNNLEGGGNGNSEILEWPIGASRWNALSTTSGMGNHHGFASHNPVHGVVWLGGGIPEGQRAANCSECTYKIDADGNVTPFAPAPMALAGIDKFSLIAADPATGLYLVFTGRSHSTHPNEFWTFDVTNGNWARQSAAGVPIFPTWQTTIVPLSNYGVLMFPKYDNNGSTVWLYKHAQLVASEPPTGLIAR